jgi:hypothetical protein
VYGPVADASVSRVHREQNSGMQGATVSEAGQGEPVRGGSPLLRTVKAAMAAKRWRSLIAAVPEDAPLETAASGDSDEELPEGNPDR